MTVPVHSGANCDCAGAKGGRCGLRLPLRDAAVVGLTAPLQASLAPLADQITAAFVYGSIAKGKDHALSDIDLMVIAENLDYASLYQALAQAETQLARPVNLNLMSGAEWRRKRTETDSFIARIAAQAKTFVLGSEHELD
jgi:predicted nucleotidyltransferase